MKIGDILVNTFGYDARIVTFWKVVGVTPKSVKIARMLDTYLTGNWLDGTIAAKTDSRLGKVTTRRLSNSYDNRPCVKTEYGFACVWDGKPCRIYNHH